LEKYAVSKCSGVRLSGVFVRVLAEEIQEQELDLCGVGTRIHKALFQMKLLVRVPSHMILNLVARNSAHAGHLQ